MAGRRRRCLGQRVFDGDLHDTFVHDGDVYVHMAAGDIYANQLDLLKVQGFKDWPFPQGAVVWKGNASMILLRLIAIDHPLRQVLRSEGESNEDLRKLVICLVVSPIS